MSEENSNFPVKIPPDKKLNDMVEHGKVQLEDLTDKQLKLFKRIYPFTPNKDLCRKFGVDMATFQAVVKKIEEM